MPSPATPFVILSHNSYGDLKIQTHKGIAYEYGGANEYDIKTIKQYLRHKQFGRAWQIINKLYLIDKKDVMQSSLFEHMFNSQQKESNASKT